MNKTVQSDAAFSDRAPPPRSPRVPNRGAYISVYGLAGACAMALHAAFANKGAVRAAFGITHGLQALVWLVSLGFFLSRPSLNRKNLYSRYADIAGACVLSFAFVYGAAAAWTGSGFPVYAAFATVGLAFVRLPRGLREWLAVLGVAVLSGVAVYARGIEALRFEILFVLTPPALGLVSGFFVDRIRREGELSLQDLRSRNVELEELAYRDPLTRLYNRRYGFENLRKAVSFSRRYGGELHILVLDIDHFKKVNDELGHPAGDEVLVELAKILQGIVRETDTVARIGGEEFLVILPYSRAEHVQGVANRIRDTTARTTFTSVPWRVTVSVGVTALREGDTADSIFPRADRFLYESKHGGRNRVTGT